MGKKTDQFTKATAGINPQPLSAGFVNGIIIDRIGYDSAKLHVRTGAVTGSPTAQSISVKMQTGAQSDGSDMADVSGDVTSAITAANSETTLGIDLSGYKRYIRVVPTVAFTGGTSPSLQAAVTVVLGEAKVIPAT